MNSRRLIDALTGPSAEEVEQVVRIILSSRTWQQANEKLEPFGVVFSDNHPDLRATGAAGGYDGVMGLVVLNAAFFGRLSPEYWRVTIEHELTHSQQMRRAKAAGADPGRITRGKMNQFTKHGNRFAKHGGVDLDLYLRDPLELQALARNAVSTAQRAGEDPRALMRSNQLRHRAPVAPRDLNRFHKYAYKMAEGLLEETERLFVSAVLTSESRRLLLQRVPPQHEAVYAHHVTMAFAPDPEMLARYRALEGQRVRIPVTAVVVDGQAQAVLVGAESENEYPHITISVAPGVLPVYSNELFEKVDWQHIPIFTVEGIVTIEPLDETPVTQR